MILRLAGGVSALLLVVAVAVAAAAFLLLQASRPQLDGEQRLSGLQAAVTVERDAAGVATLGAASRGDLMLAMGFLHAQERFFQMDLLRRAGAGELAALFGEAALDTDMQRRVFRLRQRARAALSTLAAEEQQLLRRYASGVNAGLEALAADPFEYLLLRRSPQPWRVEDSLLVAASMYFDLTDEYAVRALRLGQMSALLLDAAVDFLVPASSRWDAPLRDEALRLPPIPGAGVIDLRQMPPAWFEGGPASTRTAAEGSNSFAVAAAAGGGEGALVAGDMHLGLRLPNSWYRLRLRIDSEGLDATGVTLPGLPVLVAGSNGHLAWAFTNSYGVWSERIAVETRGDPPEAYRDGEQWRPLVRHEERITVAGGESRSLRIAESPWGVLVPARAPDPTAAADGAGRAPDPAEGWHALRWLPLADGALNLALVDMLMARDLETGLDILNRAAIPPQSALIASRDGRIGWTLAGRVPDRGAPAPQRPLSVAEAPVWQGWLTSPAALRMVDPPAGRLATANARLLAGEALALIGDGGYAFPARQQRLRDRVAAAEGIDPRMALAIQSDVRSDYLDAWMAVLDAALRSPAADAHGWTGEVRALLAGWRPQATVDNAAYRLLRLWHDRVVDAVLHAAAAPVRAQHPDFVFKPFPVAKAAVLRLAEAQPANWLDPRHDSWPAFLLAELDALILAEAAAGETRPLAERPWGEHNRLSMRHPLSAALPGLSRLLDMPAQPLPGDVDTVRVQRPSFGASQRMAVSPGRESDGVFHMPGGQSGHPLSPHYRHGHQDWVQARAAPFLPGESRHRLRLLP